MKTTITFLVLLFGSVAARADNLDTFNTLCSHHKIVPTPSLHPRPSTWESGWGHCETIVQSWTKRDADRAANTDPDLKASRDFARTLNQ